MNQVHYVALSVGVVLLSIIFYCEWMWNFLWIIFHIIIFSLGFYYAVQWNLLSSKMYEYTPNPIALKKSAVNTVIRKMIEINSRNAEQPQPRKVVISHNLDNVLQDVIDLLCRHYILVWYQSISEDQAFVKHVQVEMWKVIDKVSRRLSEIDLVRFLSQDVLDCLNQHFKNIRLAKKNKLDKSEEDFKQFLLHSWLKEEEKELSCLRNVSETLLLLLLSPPYATCAPLRHLLREIIACSVLKPTIDLLCDPDFINQKLLDYMAYREKLYADTKRTYMYSATYEGFIKKIKSSDSITDLKQMRYHIISEILQASAINALKKQQGLNTDKDVAPKGTNKGQLLKARNLERYKNQLNVAKQLCEKRIISLGGSIFEASPNSSVKEEELPGQKLFSFTVIMEMPQFRDYFMKFLKKEGAESYLGFWIAVEKLKGTSKDQRHQVASDLYQQYIVSSSSLVKVDKTILKGMEEFLRGDKGHEAFVSGQKVVQNYLEEHYYPSFIVSETYHQLSASVTDSLTSEEESATSEELFLESDTYGDMEDSLMAGQSYHAQQRLRAIDSKITNKMRALSAQKSSHKLESGSKLKKVQEDMERELATLKEDKLALEKHIARTQKWIDNIGHWSAHIYDASIITTEEDRKTPQFVILVSLSSEDEDSPHLISTSSEGWAISRTLEDFYTLHEKLSLISSLLQKKELPSSGILFKTLDKAFLTRATTMLDDYLSTVLKDDKLVHNESLYAFLSPTPEFVYQSTASEKKSKFSLPSFLKSLPSIRSEAQETEEEFMFSGDDGSEKDRSTDSIVKPLYRLVEEVFELHGLFRWFRKTLMNFVELTFGRSMDRQLKETVDQLVSEQMLIYYIQLFKDSMWPDGQPPSPAQPRSEQQKLDDRLQAKAKLLENMPDPLKTLLGEENGRRGMIKIFEVLQHKNLNKHLLYNLLEIFLLELLPELKKTKEQILRQNSASQEEPVVKPEKVDSAMSLVQATKHFFTRQKNMFSF
ncbi:sorting nexin-25 [Biomphalaria pfeifferi]|uniref:Sorting nexin-25 n=1 Tax=Biomphalaria pfeifferi TaxID=112525 RepID=A0AAD8EWI3_BIOPF|nr:sorting nexin-25 [Biomphalaria pfeifferi]